MKKILFILISVLIFSSCSAKRKSSAAEMPENGNKENNYKCSVMFFSFEGGHTAYLDKKDNLYRSYYDGEPELVKFGMSDLSYFQNYLSEYGALQSIYNLKKNDSEAFFKFIENYNAYAVFKNMPEIMSVDGEDIQTDKTGIELVRNGYLPGYKNKTVGEALNGCEFIMSSPRWTQFNSEKNIIVAIKGAMEFEDGFHNFIIMFAADINKKTFRFDKLMIDEKEQDEEVCKRVLNVLFGK